MSDYLTVHDALHYYGDEYPNDLRSRDEALAALGRLENERLELRLWAQQVHKALDGEPLPTRPDEGPARIERLRSGLQRARDHLRFHEWRDDPNSDRRAAAVAETDRALSHPGLDRNVEGE